MTMTQGRLWQSAAEAFDERHRSVEPSDHRLALSRALGVSDTLPAENIEPAIHGIEAFPAEVRAKLFAAPLGVGPLASPQTRLLAIAGRRG